jgi:phage-related protein
MPKKAYSIDASVRLARSPKPIEWVGSSRGDLRDLPEQPRRVFGYALYLAQLGLHHRSSKQLKGEFAGLVEVVDDFDGDAYRAVYTAKFADVIYVLHAFQKKSTRGIAIPRLDREVIRERLRRARDHYAKSKKEA